MKSVKIYTDGSCLNNPGIGGYCALLKYPNRKQRLVKGAELNTTNNRMELKAIIEAIKALPKGNYKIEIYSYSMISVKAINEWLHKWILQNFKKTKNIDLWKEYLKVSRPHQVQAIWIKAHNGHPENELCDKVAREEAISLSKSFREVYR
jgi:ribonuclease HI